MSARPARRDLKSARNCCPSPAQSREWNGSGATDMQWVGKLSLRHKITYVIMINTFAALCVASIAFAEYGVYRFKQMQMQDLNTLANVTGINSTAALAAKNQNSAREVLQALAAK